jgi:O-antigen ligase
MTVGLVFLLPLTPALFGWGYEQSKVLFFLSIVSLICLMWIWGSFKNPSRFKAKKSLIHLGLLVFTVTLVATSFFGINFQASLIGNPPYFQGLIVYLYCYLWFLIISTSPVKNQALYWTWIISSLVVAVIALYQWLMIHLFNLPLPTYAGRVISTFGQPSLYSGYILFTLPVLVNTIKRTSSLQKKSNIVTLVLLIFGIIISESRGALILAGGILFLWVWDSFKHSFIKYGMIVGIIFVLIVGILGTAKGDGILNQEIVRPLMGTRVGEDGQERRVYIWLFITDLIQQRPWTGYGLDNLVQVFPTAMNQLDPKPPFYFTVKDMTVDRAHNYLLDLLISGGLLTFFAWIAWYFILVAKAKKRWELVFLGIFFIYIQFQIQSIVHLIFFYTIAGLINRTSKTIEAKDEDL